MQLRNSSALLCDSNCKMISAYVYGNISAPLDRSLLQINLNNDLISDCERNPFLIRPLYKMNGMNRYSRPSIRVFQRQTNRCDFVEIYFGSQVKNGTVTYNFIKVVNIYSC